MAYHELDLLPLRAFRARFGRLETLEGGKGGDVEAPDYTPVAEANKETAELAYKSASEDLAFRKEQAAAQADQLERFQAKSEDVMDSQMATAAQNEARSAAQWQDYNSTFRPNEVQSAMDSYGSQYLSDEERAQLATLFQGGAATGTMAAPTKYDSTGYDSLQARIKAGNTNALSTADKEELASLLKTQEEYKQQALVSGHGSLFDQNPEINSMADLGMAQMSAGMRGMFGMSSMEPAAQPTLTEAQATRLAQLQARSGESRDYTLTDDDRRIESDYKAGMSAYEKQLADYKLDYDTRRQVQLSDLAKRATDAEVSEKHGTIDAQRAAQLGTINEYEEKLTGMTDEFGRQAYGRIDEYDSTQRKSMSDRMDMAAAAAAADVNSAYGQQTRALSRMGVDPNRMAAAAGNIGNAQSLARVGASNAVLRDNLDRTSALDKDVLGMRQGTDQGLFNTRFGLKGQAIQQRGNVENSTLAAKQSSKDAVVQRGVGLRTGTANFGRNMANTAGQQSMISTQAGSAAVNSGNTGAQAYLPSAQYVSGGYGGMMNAAQLQQQGNLGMANLMSGDYRAAMGASGGDDGTGAAIGAAGAIAAAAIMTSDRRLKRDIERIGTSAGGHGIYSYRYLWSAKRHVGVMADEVSGVPGATINCGGYQMVNYACLN